MLRIIMVINIVNHKRGYKDYLVCYREPYRCIGWFSTLTVFLFRLRPSITRWRMTAIPTKFLTWQFYTIYVTHFHVFKHIYQTCITKNVHLHCLKSDFKTTLYISFCVENTEQFNSFALKYRTFTSCKYVVVTYVRG